MVFMRGIPFKKNIVNDAKQLQVICSVHCQRETKVSCWASDINERLGFPLKRNDGGEEESLT